MHEEEPHTPRIYTEETVVNYFNYFVVSFSMFCFIALATRNTRTIS
jgi:hypothetical protein